MTATQHPAQDSNTPQIPVRLDFDAHAAGFARALAHLDQAATKELDSASQQAVYLAWCARHDVSPDPRILGTSPQDQPARENEGSA
jgi:hypothetical protein